MIFIKFTICVLLFTQMTFSRNVSEKSAETFGNSFYMRSGHGRLMEIAKKTAQTLYKHEAGIRELTYPHSDTPIIGKDGQRFLHVQVAGDGDCALHSFGITREEMALSLVDIVKKAQTSFQENKNDVLKQEDMSAVLETLKAIRSYIGIKNLVDLFNTDIASLKARTKKLSTEPWVQNLEVEIDKIEIEITRLRTEENLNLAQKISKLNRDISVERNKKKKDQDQEKIGQWEKEIAKIYQENSALAINFKVFEEAYEAATKLLKANLPDTYNFHYFTLFIDNFLAVIKTRIEAGRSNELTYLHDQSEKIAIAARELGSFDNKNFDIATKLIEALYHCRGQIIDFGDKKLNSRQEWFDSQLLQYIEEPLKLNVIVIDKTHGNEVRARTSGSFDTEPRYSYYVGGHYEILVPLIPKKPFPNPQKPRKAS